MTTTHTTTAPTTRSMLHGLGAIAFSLGVMAGAQAQAGGMSGMPTHGAKDAAPNAGQPANASSHQADGVVKGIDTATGRVTIAHGPVTTLNWPAMTMGFAVKDQALIARLPPGRSVHVTFSKDGNDYVITAVR